MTQKIKALATLNNARDNAIELLNIEENNDHPDLSTAVLFKRYKEDLKNLENVIDNPAAFATDILLDFERAELQNQETKKRITCSEAQKKHNVQVRIMYAVHIVCDVALMSLVVYGVFIK